MQIGKIFRVNRSRSGKSNRANQINLYCESSKLSEFIVDYNVSIGLNTKNTLYTTMYPWYQRPNTSVQERILRFPYKVFVGRPKYSSASPKTLFIAYETNQCEKMCTAKQSEYGKIESFFKRRYLKIR